VVILSEPVINKTSSIRLMREPRLLGG